MKKGQKDVPILVLLGILCFMVCLYGAELHHIIDKEIQSAAAETRELPIYSVETQEPRIALTFDKLGPLIKSLGYKLLLY